MPLRTGRGGLIFIRGRREDGLPLPASATQSGQSPAASRTLLLDIPLAAVNKAAEFEQSLAA
jgi:hypothetical protein